MPTLKLRQPKERREKNYVMVYHLGNVQVVVSDRKIAVDDDGDGVVDWYGAEVRSVADYYPGGFIMHSRSFNANTYRFKYQGSETDDAITGVTGAHITTFFREGDTRLLIWWSPDPVSKAFESPFAWMNANPVRNNDPEGDCATCPKQKQTFELGVAFGTGGIKLNFNYTLDQKLGDFTGSYGLGVTYYSNFFTTGKSGLEFRNSLMVNYDDGKTGGSLGTNIWRGIGGLQEFKQRTGMLSFRSEDFGFSYENDGTPFQYLGLGDGGDRYRTAAASISFRGLSLNMNLLTGLRNKESYGKELEMEGGKMGIPQGRGQFGENYTHGFVVEEGPKYRYGGLTINYKGMSTGINSDRLVRHPFQNIVAHDLLNDQRQFRVLSGGANPVLDLSNRGYSKFTTWGQ